MDVTKHLHEIIDHGVTVVNGVYSREQCQKYKAVLESVLQKYVAEGQSLDPECQVIDSPFRYDRCFFDLLHNSLIEALMVPLIDENYVLTNVSAMNRCRRDDLGPYRGRQGPGKVWHTDSRYVGGYRLDRGFSFIAITLLDDFSEDNAATAYIPDSHLRRERPDRYGDYDHQILKADAGSVVVFDTGLWHRSGDNPSYKSRWGIFAFYTPWFVKPYYNFPEMLGGEAFAKTVSKPLRRLFHFYSTPPISPPEREEDDSYRSTLIKPEEDPIPSPQEIVDDPILKKDQHTSDVFPDLYRILNAVKKKGTMTLAEDTDLFAAGILDSFSILEYISAIEKNFSVQITNDLLLPNHFSTIKATAEMLLRLLSHGS